MSDRDSSGRRRASVPGARRRQVALRKQLRDMFDEVAAEPLPDELTALLDRLDEKHRTRH